MYYIMLCYGRGGKVWWGGVNNGLGGFFYRPESISSTTVTLVKAAQSTQVCLLEPGSRMVAMSSGRSCEMYISDFTFSNFSLDIPCHPNERK